MDSGCSIGKTVRIRCGPAAVTGDGSRIYATGEKPGRREKHETQKPEDLPESQALLISSWIGKKVRCHALRSCGFVAYSYVPDFYKEVRDFFVRGVC